LIYAPRGVQHAIRICTRKTHDRETDREARVSDNCRVVVTLKLYVTRRKSAGLIIINKSKLYTHVRNAKRQPPTRVYGPEEHIHKPWPRLLARRTSIHDRGDIRVSRPGHVHGPDGVHDDNGVAAHCGDGRDLFPGVSRSQESR
jgi:hypothetical protein